MSPIAAIAPRIAERAQIFTRIVDDKGHAACAERDEPRSKQDLPRRQQGYREYDSEQITLFNLSNQPSVPVLERPDAKCNMPGVEQLAAEDVLLLVDHLFAKSLIVSEEGSYRLLQTVRQFTHELLSESQDEHDTRRRHFRYFCDFARHCESRLRGPQQHDWNNKHLAAHDDLRAALDFGFSQSDLLLEASDMTFNLTTFWFNGGYFSEASHYYQCAIGACPPGESDLRARLMRRGAMIRAYGGDPTAGTTVKQALDMALRVGSDQTIADAYFSYGLQASDPKDAVEHLEEALRRFEQIGDMIGVAYSFAGIGEVAFVERDYVTSRTFYVLAIERARASGDIRSEGAFSAALASVDLVQGRHEEARRGFQTAVAKILESGVMFNIYSMYPLVIQFIQQEGRMMDAARLMGWCEKVRRSVSGVRDRMDQLIYEKVDRELREKFGEHDYSALFTEGTSFTNDEAIQLANACLSDN